MTFLLAGVTLDVAQVLGLVLILLCYLSGINPNGWMTSPTSMTLIFLGGLDLKLISGRQQMGLNLFFVLVRSLIAMLLISVVFVFLDRRPISFRASGVNFPNHGVWLEAGLCFYINNLFHHFFSCIQLLSLIIHLSSNERTKTISKVVYQGLLIGGSDGVKLFQYSLQMFPIYSPVHDFLLLVLGILPDFGLVAIHKGLEIT